MLRSISTVLLIVSLTACSAPRGPETLEGFLASGFSYPKEGEHYEELNSTQQEPYDYYELYQLLDRTYGSGAEGSDEEWEEELRDSMDNNSALDWYY